ncbi:protein kinase domain-containing protein [Tautonia plasticadhaerens]|uniref:protein kinase domain-containing protein n=1 Tax=Tautonia plasticadhaerens TaxID=2527974 RepID=UPI0011A98C9C|nr:protein kinase [Tautonia plasticadhaerens]
MPAAPGGLVGLTLSGGRYEVLGLLGEGGMGQVYRARDANLQADVVIKVPHRAMQDDPEFVRRFRDEIRALVALVHPHVVRITDVGSHGDLTFAVMQYLAGGSLDGRCRGGPDGRRLPQPAGGVASWMGPVAEAIDHVHALGYIHRDVKPANILFDARGYPYLGDFGVIKAAESVSPGGGAGLTGTGMVLGTPHYMAPELIMGEPIDGRIDQYALGITVYEALAGRRPFEAEAATAVLVQQTTHQPPPLHGARPDLPASTCEAVHRAMAKDPSDRFPTCSEFARVVRASLGLVPPADSVRPAPAGRGPLKVSCPSCGRRLAAPSEAIGRKVRCPSCRHSYVLGGGGDGPAAHPGPPRGDTIEISPASARWTRPEGIAGSSPAAAPTAGFPVGDRDGAGEIDLEVPAPPGPPGRPGGRARVLIGALVASACVALAAGALVLRPGPGLAEDDPGGRASVLPGVPDPVPDPNPVPPLALLPTVEARPIPSGSPAQERAGSGPEPGPAGSEPEPLPDPEPFPPPPPPELAEPPAGEPSPEPVGAPDPGTEPGPPPAPGVVRDVPIGRLLDVPESFDGLSVIPSGYFQIGPTVRRRPDGEYATYLVAQPGGEICSRGGGPEGGPGPDFVLDPGLADALARELAGSGRTPAACIPRFEVREAGRGRWVASIVQLTVASFGSFESLYYFGDLNNTNSIALRDSVDVVLLDRSRRLQGSSPASEWEGRIGEVASGRAKTRMRQRLRDYWAQLKKMQLGAGAQQALQHGLIQGQRNQQGYDNLIQQMFGGR